MSSVLPSFITVTAALAITASAVADRMFATDSSNDGLYVFDTQSGEIVRVIGLLDPDPTRFLTPTSMAVAPYGGIFVYNNNPDSDKGLSSVDRMTGRATFIGGDLSGSLSFGPDGRLYGISPDNRLSLVNVRTGNTLPLAAPPLPNTVYGLDYNPSDGLHYADLSEGVSQQPRLLSLNPMTGAVVNSIELSEPIVGSVPGALAFERDGTLIMTSPTDRIWVIDPTTGQMTIRVDFGDAQPQGLDLIPCPADFNDDGTPNIFDFLAFQNAFDQGSPGADYDGDGALTLFDFLAFQNAFDAGC